MIVICWLGILMGMVDLMMVERLNQQNPTEMEWNGGLASNVKSHVEEILQFLNKFYNRCSAINVSGQRVRVSAGCDKPRFRCALREVPRDQETWPGLMVSNDKPWINHDKLVIITSITMVYGRHNELVNGVYKPTFTSLGGTTFIHVGYVSLILFAWC